jgi:hypothetical protein
VSWTRGIGNGMGWLVESRRVVVGLLPKGGMRAALPLMLVATLVAAVVTTMKRTPGGPTRAPRDTAGVSSAPAPTHQSQLATAPPTPLAGAWPPRHLLYFSGFDAETLGIEVDDEYVYFYQQDRRFMRAKKAGAAQPELLVQCGTCNPFRFVADPWDKAVYLLARDELVRVDRETRKRSSIALDWVHDMGGIFVDQTHVYAAMPGCAAITRVEKSSQRKEIMQVAGASFPKRAGVTKLASVGDKLLCASPSEILVIDEWGRQPRRLAKEVQSTWGVVGLTERVFWLEASRSPNTISWAPLGGGKVQRVSERGQRPQTMELVHAPSIGRLLYGTGDGIQAFDVATRTLGRSADIGYVRDLAVDAEFAYATIWGRRERVVRGTAQRDTAYWIAKVPLAELK